MSTIGKIKETADFISDKLDCKPQIGIVLGTGLGSLADRINAEKIINYSEIPNFPVSTVEGHKGKLIFGELGGKKVVAMQGRFHYYEGYSTEQTVFPVRVMKMLGVETLFVSNASGGINSTFSVGDLMIITDQINLIPNPLIGPNLEELGPRFPDMSEPYTKRIIDKATEVAVQNSIKVQYGCYVGTTGPTFETPKEYGYFRAIGGDAVGMSTTPEIIAARHMGLSTFGVSVITNLGFSGVKSTHTDVQEQGARAAENMTRLFTELLKAL